MAMELPAILTLPRLHEVAAPVYLAKHGIPKVPNDLTKPCCIGIYVRATSAT